MLKKLKNMDPMTKQFAVACVIHVTTVAALCGTAIYSAKKRSSN